MKRTERVRHREGMYSGSVQGGSDSDGRSRLSPLDLCARSPSSALRSIPESMSRFAGWHERVANRVFFFYIYSVVGVVSRPLPIVVVVLAPSRSVLRSQVTARRPVLFPGFMAVPVCAFVGRAAIRCCSSVPPGRTPSLAELASGFRSMSAILRLNRKCLRSGLAGDGLFLLFRWPFWNFICVELHFLMWINCFFRSRSEGCRARFCQFSETRASRARLLPA